MVRAEFRGGPVGTARRSCTAGGRHSPVTRLNSLSRPVTRDPFRSVLLLRCGCLPDETAAPGGGPLLLASASAIATQASVRFTDDAGDRVELTVPPRAAAGDEGGGDSGTPVPRCSSGSGGLPGAAAYLLGCGGDAGIS